MRERQRLSASIFCIPENNNNHKKTSRDSFSARSAAHQNYFRYENDRTSRKPTEHDDYDNYQRESPRRTKKMSKEEKDRAEYDELILAEAEHVAHLEFLKERIDKRERKLSGLNHTVPSENYEYSNHELEDRCENEARCENRQKCCRSKIPVQNPDDPLIDLKNRENRRILQRQSDKLHVMRENYKRICSLSDGEGEMQEDYCETKTDPRNREDDYNDALQREQIRIFQLNRQYKPTGVDNESVTNSVETYSDGHKTIIPSNYQPSYERSKKKTKDNYFYGNDDNDKDDYHLDGDKAKRFKHLMSKLRRMKENEEKQKITKERNYFDPYRNNIEIFNNDRNKIYMKDNESKRRRQKYNDSYNDSNKNFNDNNNNNYAKRMNRHQLSSYRRNSSNDKISKPQHHELLMNDNEQLYSSALTTNTDSNKYVVVDKSRLRNDIYKYSRKQHEEGKQTSINNRKDTNKNLVKRVNSVREDLLRKGKYDDRNSVKRTNSYREGATNRYKYDEDKHRRRRRGSYRSNDGDEDEEFDRKNETGYENYVKSHRKDSRVEYNNVHRNRKKSTDSTKYCYRRREGGLEKRSQDRKHKTAHTFCNCNQKGRVRCSRKPSDLQRKRSDENQKNRPEKRELTRRDSKKGFYDTIKGELTLERSCDSADDEIKKRKTSNKLDSRSGVNIVIEGPSDTVSQESESEKSETIVTTDENIQTQSKKTPIEEVEVKKSPTSSKEIQVGSGNLKTHIDNQSVKSDSKKTDNSGLSTVSVTLTDTKGVVQEINVNEGSAAIIKFVSSNSTENLTLSNENICISTKMLENQRKINIESSPIKANSLSQEIPKNGGVRSIENKHIEHAEATKTQNDSQNNHKENANAQKEISTNESQNRSQNGTTNGSQVGSQNISQNRSQTGSQNASQNGSQIGSQNASQNGSQIGSQNGSQIGSQNISQNGSNVESQNGSQNTTQNGLQNGELPNKVKTNLVNNNGDKVSVPNTSTTNHIIIVVADQTPKIDGYTLVKDNKKGTTEKDDENKQEPLSTDTNDNMTKYGSEDMKKTNTRGKENFHRGKPPLRGGAVPRSNTNVSDSDDLYKSNNSSLLRKYSIRDKNRKEEKNKMDAKVLKWQLRQRNKVKHIEDNYNGITQNNEDKDDHYLRNTKNKMKQIEKKYNKNSNNHNNKEHHYVLDKSVTDEEQSNENVETNHDRKLQYMKDRYGRLRRCPVENEIINTSAIGRSSISISRFIVRNNDDANDYQLYSTPESESSGNRSDDEYEYDVTSKVHLPKEHYSRAYHVKEQPMVKNGTEEHNDKRHSTGQPMVHRKKEPRSPYDTREPTTTLDKLRLMKERYKQIKYDKEM